MHQGARGYLMSSEVQRRVREAQFVAIVTPAIKHLRKEIARLSPRRCRHDPAHARERSRANPRALAKLHLPRLRLIYDEAEGDPDSGLAAGTRFCRHPRRLGLPAVRRDQIGFRAV
jgi:rubredoxin